MKYKNDPRWTYSKFPSVCKGCGKQIKKGEPIFYFPKGKDVFCDGDNCGKRESQFFNEIAQDEDQFINRSM